MLEPITFNPQGLTLISIHLMLAAEQSRRPTLTLAKFWVELSPMYKRMELPRPKSICAKSIRSLCGSRCISPWHMLGPTGEARIDERATLVVFLSFVVPHAAPIPLHVLVDTGSGVSILKFSTFNRVVQRGAVQIGAMLKPYQIDLYAANGTTIKTFGMAEHVRFQLGDYELETNFVVVTTP